MDDTAGAENLIPFVLKRHLSSAGGSNPVSKRRVDHSSSELQESDESIEQVKTTTHEYQRDRVDNGSGESDDEENLVPRCKIDKGKGKAKASNVPELPDDVWKRVFELYLDDCAEDWHDSNRYRGALKPLLLSKDLTSVALPILYTHPMISFSAIPSFLRALSYGSAPYNALPKASYVRHLTIRPSPPAPSLEFSQQAYKDYQSRHVGANPLTIHASLPLLLHHIPQLHTFTLKDTLILHGADAALLFGALSLTRPKKARLEFRMWDLHDSPIGDVLVAANRPSIHHPTTTRAGGPRQPQPHDARTPHQRRNNQSGGSMPVLQEAWRDALLQGGELEIPSEWLELGLDETHPPAHPPAPIHPPVIPLPPVFLTTVHNHLSGSVSATSRHSLTTTSAIPTASDINHSPAHAPLIISDSVTAHSTVTPPQLDLSEASHADAEAPSTDEIGLPRRPAVNLIHRASYDPQSHVSQVNDDVWGTWPPSRPWTSVLPSTYYEPGRLPSQWASSLPLRSATTGDHSSLGGSTRRRLQSNLSSPAISATYPLGSQVATTSHEATGTCAASSEPSTASSMLTDTEMSQSETEATTSLTSTDTTATMSSETEPTKAVRASSPRGYSADNGDSSDFANSDTPLTDTSSSSIDVKVSENSPPAPRLSSGWYIPPTIATASENLASTVSPSDEHRPATRDSGIRIPSPDFGDLSSLQTDMPAASAPSSITPSQSTESEADGVMSSALRSGSVWAIPPHAGESIPSTDTHVSQPPLLVLSHNGRFNRQSSRRRAAHNAVARNTAVTDAALNEATRSPEDAEIEGQMTRMPGVTGHALARVIRGLLRDLIEISWSPRVHGLSVVLLDPLASLIVRAPDLDLWTRLPVEHIRVHLPRGCNPLAVFKGIKEYTRDRSRRPRLPGNGRLPVMNDEQRRIVGGDGMGGGLLHPAIELFEIEVNTLAEMHDQVWIKNGDQLPPEVCRILVGEHDWRDLKIGPSVRSNYMEDQEIPRTSSPMTDNIGSPHFSFVSIDDDDSSDDEFRLASDSDEEGETYNAQAAEEQRMRMKERVMM